MTALLITHADPRMSFDCNDPLAIARNFVAVEASSEDGARLIHHHRGEFMRFHAGAYHALDDATVRAGLYRYLDSVPLLADGKPRRPARAIVDGVADALAAVVHVASSVEPPAWLCDESQPDPRRLLAFPNGLLSLATGELLPSDPRFFTRNAVTYAFDPNASPPRGWLAFLDSLWGDDPESIATLQEVFGYLLTSDTQQQKLFLLIGPKRSGKGTIARVLRALLGECNVTGPTLSSLGTNFGLWPLIGRSLAIVSDARLGARADQAVIAERLLAISGEDAMTIDRKYLAPWTGRLGVRWLILTNETPRLADASGALASRFVVMQLRRSFYGTEDTELTDRLLQELPSILLWALDGLERLWTRGRFVQPESAADAIRELEELGSPVRAFVDAECIVGPDQFVVTEDLFRRWCEWCVMNGRTQPGNAQSLGRDLRAAVPSVRRTRPRDGPDRIGTYAGIGLRRGVIV
jgi:putative DNA primase/helicase